VKEDEMATDDPEDGLILVPSPLQVTDDLVRDLRRKCIHEDWRGEQDGLYCPACFEQMVKVA
jgi:hypothetical protein